MLREWKEWDLAGSVQYNISIIITSIYFILKLPLALPAHCFRLVILHHINSQKNNSSCIQVLFFKKKFHEIPRLIDA